MNTSVHYVVTDERSLPTWAHTYPTWAMCEFLTYCFWDYMEMHYSSQLSLHGVARPWLREVTAPLPWAYCSTIRRAIPPPIPCQGLH